MNVERAAESDRTGSVLLVEDQVLIRLDMAEELREAGFTVIEAANGDEAIAVLRAISSITAVITDHRMPGKTDGLTLTRWLRREMPHVKTMLISGNTNDLPLDVADLTLSKPLLGDLLTSKLRLLLAGTAG